MDSTYELWDVCTANVIGMFSTEAEAIAAVHTLLDTYGSSYAADLSLSRRVGSRQACVVAAGEQLIALTNEQVAEFGGRAD